MHTIKFRETANQTKFQYHNGSKWIDTTEEIISDLYDQWETKSSRSRHESDGWYFYEVDNSDKLVIID